MQYAPPISSNIGNILANAGANSAQTYMQGMQNFGQSIGKGLEKVGDSVGDALTEVFEKKQEDASKAATLGSALDMMNKTLPMYGAEGIDLHNTIQQRMAEAGNNLDKMSGIWLAAQPAVDNLRSRYNQQAQYNAAKDLYDYKTANAAPAAPKYDFNYATEFNKALYDNGITDTEQRKQKFNEAGVGHLWDKFIAKQNMGFFGPITQ